MRTITVTERIGENVGPVDWNHETAKNMPPMWREAEFRPENYLINGRTIIAMCMYDGWPYWKPTPAVRFVGPIGCEWAFFNSYGVYPDSISRRAA